MKNLITFASTSAFTSNAAIAVYIVIAALLIVAIAFTTILDIKKKNEFKLKSSLDQAEKDKKRKMARFPELLEIDKKYPTFQKETETAGITLASFCTNFRNFAAKELGLFYSIEDIRKFVASLGVSKLMILQGMSGTGKTSIAVALGRYISAPSTVIPIQPMWKERSDLLGYYNEFTTKFNETVILERLYEASYTNKIFIIVLDELNIARVEYYFSEFLSLLELPVTSDRRLVVAAAGANGDPKNMSHGKIPFPDNVWFLGTANNDDSTFAITDKVYDRAMVLNLDKRAQRFNVEGAVSTTHISYDQFTKLVSEALKSYALSDDAKKKISTFDNYLSSTFHVTFGNRILMQIGKYVPLYLACGGTETEALDDMVSKKILRKLEAQNPVFIKSKSEEIIAKLDEVFGQDAMKNCIEYITKLSHSA